MKCLNIESFEYCYFIPIVSQLAEYWGDVKMASLGKIMSQQVKQNLIDANNLHFLLSSCFPDVDSKRKESKIKRYQNKEQLKDYLLLDNKIHTLFLTEKSSSIFPMEYEESFNFSSSYLSFSQSSSLLHTTSDETSGWANRRRLVEQNDLKHRASYNIPISQIDPTISYTIQKKIDLSHICENKLKNFDSSKSSPGLNSNVSFQSYGNRREKKKKNKFSPENFYPYGLEEEKNILSQLYKLDYFFFQLLNKTKKEEFQEHKITLNLFSDLFLFFPTYESVLSSSKQLKNGFAKPIKYKNKIGTSIWEISEKDLYFLFLQILRDRKIWKAKHWYPFLSRLSLNFRFLSFSHMLSSSFEFSHSSKNDFSSKFPTKEHNNLSQDPSINLGSTKELIEKKMCRSFIKLSESEKHMSELVTMLLNK
jgi:hypothetical protein